VGIVAAFLGQQGRPDGVAPGLDRSHHHRPDLIGVGVALQTVSDDLTPRQGQARNTRAPSWPDSQGPWRSCSSNSTPSTTRGPGREK
jgi:hypothetical protein